MLKVSLLVLLQILSPIFQKQPSSASPPSMVTGQYCTGAGFSGSASCTLPSGTTSGNTLVAGMYLGNSETMTCSDPVNGPYTNIGSKAQNVGSGIAVQMAYKANAASITSAQAITCSGSGGANARESFAIEIQGANTATPLDTSATGVDNSGASSVVSASLTAATNTFGVGIAFLNVGGTNCSNNNWTYLTSNITNFPMCIWTQSLPSGGAQSNEGTISTNNYWSFQGATFKP